MKGKLTWTAKIKSVSVFLWALTVKSAAAAARWPQNVLVFEENSPDSPAMTHSWLMNTVNVIKLSMFDKYSSEICTFVMSSVTMWSPLWRITPNNRTRFLWWRFLEKRRLWMCNRDTEQVTEEEMLLRHDWRLFEEGLSGYVTFDVLNGDPLACVFTLEHSWNISITVRLIQMKIIQHIWMHPSSVYDLHVSYDFYISPKQL